MSGHNPTILELTMVSHESAMRALALLKRRHLGRLQAHPTESDVRSAQGPILLGNQEVVVSVDFEKDPSDVSQTYATIEIDSRAYEAAYDVLRGRANRRGREALIKFCAEVAAAAGAEGFRLRFVGDIAPPPLTVALLVESLTSVDGRPGLVAGIRETSDSWNAVKDYYPSWSKVDHYQVVAFI